MQSEKVAISLRLCARIRIRNTALDGESEVERNQLGLVEEAQKLMGNGIIPGTQIVVRAPKT